jgi:hypothetical protein
MALGGLGSKYESWRCSQPEQPYSCSLSQPGYLLRGGMTALMDSTNLNNYLAACHRDPQIKHGLPSHVDLITDALLFVPEVPYALS